MIITTTNVFIKGIAMGIKMVVTTTTDTTTDIIMKYNATDKLKTHEKMKK